LSCVFVRIASILPNFIYKETRNWENKNNTVVQCLLLATFQPTNILNIAVFSAILLLGTIESKTLLMELRLREIFLEAFWPYNNFNYAVFHAQKT